MNHSNRKGTILLVRGKLQSVFTDSFKECCGSSKGNQLCTQHSNHSEACQVSGEGSDEYNLPFNKLQRFYQFFVIEIKHIIDNPIKQIILLLTN